MAASLALLGIDLGAESGRAMLGRFDGERMALDELARFPNEPLTREGHLRWDVGRLERGIVEALRAATARGIALDALALDTWGVDYGRLDARGNVIDLPFHYRDTRTIGMVRRAGELVDREWLYARTGCQTLVLNTLYQLLADQVAGALAETRTILLMPDLLAYRLTGERAAEQTIASTTQLYDPVTQTWAFDVIEALGLPSGIFPSLQPPGARRGALLPEIAAETGVRPGLPVIAVGSHDTASAFAAVTSGSDSLVVSSGTWSLVGIETPAPILTEAAREANFTNEAGVFGTTRFLRNMGGMWPIQECRRTWRAEGKSRSYDELGRLAAAAPPLRALIHPSDPTFVAPGEMPARIAAYCARTGQPAPETPGQFVRAVLESLAIAYRWMVAETERVSGRRIARLHIIGGGSRSALHCQLAADATGLPVLAGPAEATALGNVMMQAYALCAVGSLAEMRAVIARSFAPIRYEPTDDRAIWDDAYRRFQDLTGRS